MALPATDTGTALRRTPDAQAALGECPVWSASGQVLHRVDTLAPALDRHDPATGRNVAIPMPESIGCFALRARGAFVGVPRSGSFAMATHVQGLPEPAYAG